MDGVSCTKEIRARERMLGRKPVPVRFERVLKGDIV